MSDDSNKAALPPPPPLLGVAEARQRSPHLNTLIGGPSVNALPPDNSQPTILSNTLLTPHNLDVNDDAAPFSPIGRSFDGHPTTSPDQSIPTPIVTIPVITGNTFGNKR